MGTPRSSARRVARLVPWLIALALVALVVVVAGHAAEERAFLRLLDEAHPWWVLVAAALQAGTYVAQADIWRRILTRAGVRPSLARLTRLSLAKLFIDQVVPTGGFAGTFVVVRSLGDQPGARGRFLAVLVVSTVSYYAAYALLLVACTGFGAGYLQTWMVTAVGVVGVAIGALALAMPWSVGQGVPRLVRALPLGRWPRVRERLALLAEADATITRDVPLAAETTALQLVIMLLDAASLWALLASVGVSARPGVALVAFMLASLARTVGVVPGGLGTFEATSVAVLALGGVPVAAALAATMLFRGLSFWLPMLPGLWAVHAEGLHRRDIDISPDGAAALERASVRGDERASPPASEDSMIRKASAAWRGDLKTGKGQVSTGSGALKALPYDFKQRFEDAPGTNPEELVGAAHAACYSMAFSLFAANAGVQLESVETTAAVTLEAKDGGFAVTKIHLDVIAKVPGASPEVFQKIAEDTKANCPISKLLKAEITLSARQA